MPFRVLVLSCEGSDQRMGIDPVEVYSLFYFGESPH